MNVSLKMNLLGVCRSTTQAAARRTTTNTQQRFASSFPRPNQLQRPAAAARSVAIPFPAASRQQAGWSKVAAVGLGAGFSIFGVNAFSGSSKGGFPKAECESEFSAGTFLGSL